MGWREAVRRGSHAGRPRSHHHVPDRRRPVERYLPGYVVLRRYDRRWLRGDLLAGITVAAYLIPQVMAYAEVAGLPAVMGLWACLGPLVVYAFAGTSRQLSVGPESTTALMTAVALAGVAGALGGDRRADVAATLALLVGLFCVLGGLGRLGFLAGLLSRPVLVGYMAGIAVLMIASQLGKITGRKIAADGALGQVADAASHLDQIHVPTLVMAIMSVVALLLLRRFVPLAPGPLVVMLACAAAVAWTPLREAGLRTVGAVPAGLPAPRLPDLTGISVGQLVPAALGLAIVGYSDNVLTGRALAERRKERIDANTEFTALGLANIAAGLTHGFPVSSSGSRAVLGDSMGSRTQLYSLVAVVGIVLTMYVGGPVLAAFPTAALGAVVVYAALRLIDVPELRRLWRFRLSELWLAVATGAGVVVFDVLTGIGIAIVLSVIDLLRRIGDPHDGVLGYVPGRAGMHDIDDYPTAQQIQGLIVYRYDSPLFFANADNFRRRALEALDEGVGEPEWFVLNAEAINEIDLTALDALESLRAALAERWVTFAMARVKHELADDLAKAGFTDRVGEQYVFATLPSAVHAYVAYFTARHGAPPPGLPDPLPPIHPEVTQGPGPGQ
ncbi:MAG: sulfate permease [Austwickia sp.]|jgi:SulP family sulfate permease|nr:MAG: sulfate permease [Austwickia sp.]